jgi:hypothetical protein
MKASEMRGERPSSRRRLAQKAASTMAATAAVSGTKVGSGVPCWLAGSDWRAKKASTIAAAARARGYAGSVTK